MMLEEIAPGRKEHFLVEHLVAEKILIHDLIKTNNKLPFKISNKY